SGAEFRAPLAPLAPFRSRWTISKTRGAGPCGMKSRACVRIGRRWPSSLNRPVRFAAPPRRTAPEIRKSVDRGLDDLARRTRRLALGEGVDVLHALDHLAPDRVLAVEEAGIVEADEELAVGAVRVRGAGHGADAAHVRLGREFLLQVRLRGARGAGAGRVAALGHEARDDAVEDDAVVEAFRGQLGDLPDVV